MADKVYGHAIKGFAARLLPDQVRKLRSDGRVDSVEPDRIITAFPQTPPTGVRRIATDQNAIAAIDGVDANGGLGLDTASLSSTTPGFGRITPICASPAAPVSSERKYLRGWQ